MANVINIALRGLQFFFALLVMALTGNMIAMSDAGNGGIVNYSMFCSVFAMLSLLFLLPAAFKESWQIHPIFPVALDVLNTLFWFCGAVAFAAYLGAHSCSNQAYLDSNSVTQGSEKRCREGQASTAFLWFGFAAFVASAVITGLGSRGSASVRPGGIRRGPAMSQV